MTDCRIEIFGQMTAANNSNTTMKIAAFGMPNSQARLPDKLGMNPKIVKNINIIIVNVYLKK